jgi:hypothetical protein
MKFPELSRARTTMDKKGGRKSQKRKAVADTGSGSASADSSNGSIAAAASTPAVDSDGESQSSDGDESDQDDKDEDEDEDEDGEMEVVNADFDSVAAQKEDFHGIKTLLRQVNSRARRNARLLPALAQPPHVDLLRVAQSLHALTVLPHLGHDSTAVPNGACQRRRLGRSCD